MIGFGNFLVSLIAVGLVAGVLFRRTFFALSTKKFFLCLLMIWGAISVGVMGGYIFTTAVYIFKGWPYRDDNLELIPSFVWVVYAANFVLSAILTGLFIWIVENEDKLKRTR